MLGHLYNINMFIVEEFSEIERGGGMMGQVKDLFMGFASYVL